MKKALVKFVLTYLVFLLVFLAGKPLFLAVYHHLYTGIGAADVFAVMWHGLSVDMAMAAYLTLLPGLLTALMLVSASKVLKIIEKGYFIAVSVVLALVFVADLVLYGYWGFRLDATPLFYFLTSPSAAFASATWVEAVAGVAGCVAGAALIYVVFRYTAMRVRVMPVEGCGKSWRVAAMILLTAALFIPIRGGFTVSTMNPSRAYFSTDQKMNHAAMNPAFSFMYSVSHQNSFEKQFRFMDGAEADRLFADMTPPSAASDTSLVNTQRPDIWIIIAESFSTHLMPSLGGEPVAMRLDSIARDGLLFSRFYASSFRTDRALPAILSAFPGQPNTSVMKFVSKAERLPSMPRKLAEAGYDTQYYYGGDVNFTNMLAFLKNGGFERIVCDKDFSLAQRANKWGAHDSDLFNRIISDLKSDTTASSRLRVVQTSSSHEPFEVPYTSRFDNKRLNAFAFADSCIGAFVDSLKSSPRWDRSLVVIVPDHFGVYPENLTDEQQRHRIPLVMTGGALALKGTVDTVGSQTDIAATILGALGIDASEFTYSRNLLDSAVPHYAFYTSPSAMGFVTENDTVDFNLDSNKAAALKGPDAKAQLESAKAYIQKLYDNLSKL